MSSVVETSNADTHSTVDSSVTTAAELSGKRDAEQRRGHFLIGPKFDSLFVANIYWPLLFAVCWFSGDDVRTGVLFWQVYFITAPHRWITLILVSTDRNRTRGRGLAFVGIAVAIVGGVCLLQLSTASLLCLGAIDYVWNAWHFAAQHHGIYRIYQRKSSVAKSPAAAPYSWIDTAEKAVFRAFLLYVIARVAGTGWHIGPEDWTWQLKSLDVFVAAIPVLLLAVQAIRCRRLNLFRPGQVYYFSVMALFLAMLWAAHAEQRHMVLQLALASAVFHSVEYMAVVTWASTSEAQKARRDLVGTMARTWVLFLAFFVLFLGFTNYMIASGYQHLWIMLNLMVAFLHYAYDGMIWKARRASA